MMSALFPMHTALYGIMGAAEEWAALIEDVQRPAILKALAPAYYEHIAPQKTVIDTHRGWCSRMPMIAELYPEARVIVCLREFAWIIDSFERIFTKHPLQMSRMYNLQNGATVYTRAEALGGPNGTVGYAWHAAREAIFGEFASRLIVVDFEALTRDPQKTVSQIYKALGLAEFKHDFDNIEFEAADAFDTHFGAPGMHSVRRKVEYTQRKTVLPPDIILRYQQNDYWKTREFQRLPIPMCIYNRV